jgi:hypothetical protein
MHPTIIKVMASCYASILFDYFILLRKEGEENQCRKVYSKIWPADGSSSSNLETPNPIVLTFTQVQKNKHIYSRLFIFFNIFSFCSYQYIHISYLKLYFLKTFISSLTMLTVNVADAFISFRFSFLMFLIPDVKEKNISKL